MRRFRFLHRLELEVLDAAEAVDEATTEVESTVVVVATTVELVSAEVVEAKVVAAAAELNDVAVDVLFPSPQNVMRRLTLSAWHAT